ncbi:MAG: hypothetical protein Q8L15_14865 [Methylobacter sp.]|nr:hypothetical protein [Methylobacter sp.]
MKSIFTFLTVLTLSFNVFAVEVQEESNITANDQIALNQENSPDTHLASHRVNSQTIPQASTEKPSEYITELSVYLIIIIVYSIYGFKTNSKNAGN